MLALQYSKNIIKYSLIRFLLGRFPRLVTGPGTLLRLAQMPLPELPAQSWVLVRPILSGICGSDLAAIAGKSSIYLSAFTSFPFVPGHEVVGLVVETGHDVSGLTAGDRVVLEPALGCEVRGFSDQCFPCTRGHYSNCERVIDGDISAGIQTGYCSDTGGGWGSYLVAHQTQLHNVPHGMSNEAAVLTEPLSCALHGVLGARVNEDSKVLVVGAGTVGLLTVAALRNLVPTCTIVVVAKYPHQRKMASELGCDHVVTPGSDLYEQLSKLTDASMHTLPLGKPAIVGGFDITFECAGSGSGFEDAIRWTRAQGSVVLTGMPHFNTIDLTPMWYKELSVIGSYTYGVERYNNEKIKTFKIALDMLSGEWGRKLATLVRHRFSIKRHKDAMEVAMRPGKFEAIKTVFEPVEDL